MALKRFVNGVGQPPFYQKRAPDPRPEWIETVVLRYPSGRTAQEIVVRDEAQLAWVVNLGCVDLHPHAVRDDDLQHPDELRVDLDPVPGVEWPQVRRVALVVRDVLADYGLQGWPKTSGSRGFHVYCRIAPRWTFREVHRAALALAREVEDRAPDLATARWWKEERHGVFVDYNQNAKDRTTCSAFSVRPTADARVSMPLWWDEVPDCEPGAFTIDNAPARLTGMGDAWAAMDETVGSLTPLLELAERHREAGLAEPPPLVAAGRGGTGQGGAGRGRAGQGGAEPAVPAPAPGKRSGPAGRRRTTVPLIEIARSASKEEALAGLERWKARHPDVWPHLRPADILVDSMRGRSSTWTRIRLNLQHVPADQRPEQEALEVDYDPGSLWIPLPGEDPPTR
jgi:DNA ligase D-like protein (predicted polymerase)